MAVSTGAVIAVGTVLGGCVALLLLGAALKRLGYSCCCWASHKPPSPGMWGREADWAEVWTGAKLC